MATLMTLMAENQSNLAVSHPIMTGNQTSLAGTDIGLAGTNPDTTLGVAAILKEATGMSFGLDEYEILVDSFL